MEETRTESETDYIDVTPIGTYRALDNSNNAPTPMSGRKQADDERPLTSGTNYEDAVAATGYGRFHYLVLAMCGWALSSDAIEVLSISFVLPEASQPHELDMTTSDKGWLNAVIFIGMMLGGYLWGALADIYGRRRVLLISLTINGLGGLASSFAQQFWLFFALRFVSGIGVGGSLPVIFSYYVEFQPKGKRGSMISLLATFWMSGSIVCSALAWIIIPRTYLDTVTPTFSYSSWRIFIAACTAPAISSALFFFLMPESPRYLLNNGDEQQALQVLKRMFKSNNSAKKEIATFPITELQIPDTAKCRVRRIPGPRGRCKAACHSFITAILELLGRTAELFRSPFTRMSTTLIIIYFTLSFGYYGLFMWFPELLDHMERTGGSPCSLGDQNSSAINTDVEVDSNIYLNTFIINLSNLPGNIFTFFLIDRIKNGRNILLAASMVISGVCVFFIAILKTKTQSLIMSCVFSGISVIGWNALDVISMELYPTHLRSTASGLEMGMGRIASILANVLFGQLMAVHCLVPMFLVAGFMTVGGLSAFLLPNMQGKDVDRLSTGSGITRDETTN